MMFIFLLVIVAISYGQLLWMFPWQDDHALMFKLGNIMEKAGYLGNGIFGEGPYKYTAAYYYPIFKLFEYNIPIYFLLSFILYFLATLSVYYLFSKIFDKNSGKLAGFLFAAGYIASDGFIRLYNSFGTSLSVILISFLTYFYWKFYKRRESKFYLIALALFFLATELVRYRTHYLISVVLVFELLFFAFSKPIFKSLGNSILRLLPFGYIFYKYFVVAGDSRSGKVIEYIQALLRGEFYQTYSFFASLTNLVTSDWLLRLVFKFMPTVGSLFSNPVLNLQPKERIIPCIGVVIFFISIYLIFKIKENKLLFTFFLFWVFINIASYAAYLPTNAYETTNRLLAHSFFALIGLFVILAKKNRIILLLIIFWGLGNLINSYKLQKNIIFNRSTPAKIFYLQLKEYVPNLEKGDVLYFDVAESVRQEFADSFSVAQMPEETAIVWQYGMDRYDIRRITEYNDFKKIIDSGVITDINKKEVKINNIYSFFYSDNGLIETTNEFTKELNNKESENISFKTKETDDGIEIEFDKPIKSITPNLLQIELQVEIPDSSSIKFPLINNNKLLVNPVAKDEKLRQQAFNYQKYKNTEAKSYKIKTSNVWKDSIPDNLIDHRNDTYWRADRVLWYKEGASLTIDLQSTQSIDKFVWINGYSNDTPTKYLVETSLDNKNWETVIEKKSSKRIEPNAVNVDKFDSVNARFIKMTVINTLSNDSASIAEVWVIPAIYKDLDIVKTEEFLGSPLGYVPSKESYIATLSGLNYFGDIQVYWLNNKSKNYQTLSNSIIKVRYDKIPKTYNITIPAGGTEVTKLKLLQNQIIGNIILRSVHTGN